MNLFDFSVQSKKESFETIRVLKDDAKFEMSGYEEITGECTRHNLNILDIFAEFGIYDYTSYLFLDFYKGSPVLYLKYFYENENLEFDLSGYGTTEIIYKILKATVLSGKKQRRRN